MAFLTPFLPAIGSWVLSKFAGGGSGDAAASQAQQLSEEQRALLKQMYGWGEQYGGNLLSNLWQYAQQPYEDAYSRNLFQRERQNIESGYRPAFAAATQNLSRRGMWSPYSTQPRRMAGQLDIARGGAVAQAAMARAADKSNEQARRLQAFGDVLAQLRGGNVSGAGAYSSPISTYAQLAQQAGQNSQQMLQNIMQWIYMNKAKSNGPAGSTGYQFPSHTGTTYGNGSYMGLY